MSHTLRISHRCAGYLTLRGIRTRCLKRLSMRLPWNLYVHAPKCPQCGGRTWWVDTHRRRRADRPVCYCSAYPHRPGSIAGCEQAKEPRYAN